jgi:hypothetical protein
MTSLDVAVPEHCSRLMDASLQLLTTVRSMESQLARQKQTRREEAQTPTAAAIAIAVAGAAAEQGRKHSPIYVQ